MTAATIKNEIRQLLGEIQEMQWTDAQILQYIQLASAEAQKISSCCEVYTSSASYDIPLTQTQCEYSIAADYPFVFDADKYPLKIYSATYIATDYNAASMATGKGLLRIQPKQFGHLPQNAEGEPVYYAEFAQKFWVWPAPDETTAHVHLKASAINHITVADLEAHEDDDLEEVPEAFRNSLIQGGMMYAKIKDGKHAQAAMYFQQMVQAVWFLRQDVVERQMDSLDMFMLPDKTVTV